MARNNLVGAWGEAQAAEYLRKKHYKILEREFKDKLNEDEFMALDEILEIKRRRDKDWGKFGLFEY